MTPARAYRDWLDRAGGETALAELAAKTADGFDIQPLYGPNDRSRSGRGAAPAIAEALIDQPPAGRFRRLLEWRGDDQTQELIAEDLQFGVRDFALRLPAADAAPSIEDIAAPFDGITDVAIHIEGIGLAAAAMTLALWRRLGAPPHACLGLDPWRLALDQSGPQSDAASALDACAQIGARAHGEYAEARTLVIDGTLWHEAASPPARELGLMLASAVACLRAFEAQGLNAAAAAPQFELRVAVDQDLYLSLVKIRALRLLWDQILAACGVPEGRRRAQIAAHSSSAMSAQRDPWNNVPRSSIAALAAVAGGCDLLGVTAAAATNPKAGAAIAGLRQARALQLLLTQESHINEVVDPMAGSWFGESLTENLAQRAWQEFNSIEQRGGMVAAIADGWVHARTESAAAALISDIACLRQPIIGVSLHPPTEADEGGVTFDPEPRDRAREQTNAEPGAAGGGIGAWLDGAVEDWQSGRACAAPGLPASTSPPLRALRRSLPFEQLWLAAGQQRAKGQGPRALLACLGPATGSVQPARAASDLLAAAGIEAVFASSSEAAAKLSTEQLKVAVLCGAADDFSEAAKVAAELKTAGASLIAAIGPPADFAAEGPVFRRGGNAVSFLELLLQPLLP